VLALAALSVAAVGGASAEASTGKLAEHLRELDPAALLGGESIVGTRPGQQLHGVHGKPNFIVALGDDETIHGASKNDQLGALGDGAKIVPSHQGHSLIVAGPHSKVVVPGKGHNLIYSHAKGATIILESPGDEVIANGPHDRIVCTKHAHNELIEVAKGAKVSKSCRGHHNQIEHITSSSLSARSSSASAHASTTTVTGSGTNEDPYTAECDFPEQQRCTVDSFAERSLRGYWANEYVPAYKCPADHPYLLNVPYAPSGTRVPPGVEVLGLGPIGVSITDTLRESDPPPGTSPRSLGTRTGFPSSSATNWTDGIASYEIVLHCTNNRSDSYS
jgi:hypothetical protein